MSTKVYEPDTEECYMFCECTDCNGRIFDNQDAAEAHIESITGPAEIVLVNVGLN